jgi:hypothetical protein
MSSSSGGSSSARKRINFNFTETSNDVDRYLVLASKVGPNSNESVEAELHKANLDYLKMLEKELKDTAWMFKY